MHGSVSFTYAPINVKPGRKGGGGGESTSKGRGFASVTQKSCQMPAGRALESRQKKLKVLTPGTQIKLNLPIPRKVFDLCFLES